MTEGGSASWWEPRRAGPRVGRGPSSGTGAGTSPRTASACALRPSCDRERAGVAVAQGLRPGKPAAARGGWESGNPQLANCTTWPVPCASQPMVTQGPPGLEKFPGSRRSGYDSIQVHTPSSMESPPTPTHGNIRSHLARRGAAGAAFADTRGTGWSRPHLDAFLTLRPA